MFHVSGSDQLVGWAQTVEQYSMCSLTVVMYVAYKYLRWPFVFVPSSQGHICDLVHYFRLTVLPDICMYVCVCSLKHTFIDELAAVDGLLGWM